MDRALLKPAEVNEILGLGRSKVYELLACGILPRYVWALYSIPKSSLEGWIKERITGQSANNVELSGHLER